MRRLLHGAVHGLYAVVTRSITQQTIERVAFKDQQLIAQRHQSGDRVGIGADLHMSAADILALIRACPVFDATRVARCLTVEKSAWVVRVTCRKKSRVIYLREVYRNVG